MKKLYTIYILIITQGLSLIGSRMSSIAIGIWLFHKTGNTAPLLLVSFFNELPGMLLGNFAGVVVDRYKRKSLLILSDSGQALGTSILFVILIINRFQVSYLYMIVLIQGVFSMIQGPAADASTTMLVPEGLRDRVNALKEMLFPMAGVIAPIITGMLYVFIGLSGIVIIDFITFLISVAVLLFIKIPEPKVSIEGLSYKGTFFQEALSGFKYLASKRGLLILVIYFTIINFLLNGPLELVMPYLIKITNSDLKMSVILGITNLGAFAGAGLIVVWGGTKRRINTIIPGYLITGLMFIAFGMVRTSFLLASSIFTLMIPLPITWALFKSILQVKTPPDIQGRVFAAMMQFSFVASTLSFLITGPLVDKVLEPAVLSSKWGIAGKVVGNKPGSGMGFVLVVTGVIMLLITAAVFMINQVRHLEEDLPDYQTGKE